MLFHNQPEKNSHNTTGWCLTSGGAGHEAQCMGVFESLGIKPVIKRVNPTSWYRNLAPICPAQPHPEIVAPWPDLLIVSGRHALPYARLIKRRSGQRTFTVVLQKPGLPPGWFNFIWIPQHDNQLKASNVFPTLTPPNRLSDQRLVEATTLYQHLIEDLPRPVVTVLIGGASRSFQFGMQEAKELADDLIKLHHKTGCSFLISPSYRTGKTFIDFFNDRLSNIPAKIWNMVGENPLWGYMALGEFFIVTADSINMLGEAAFTGRPIYGYPIPHKNNKFSSFYNGLIESGAMRWFDGNLELWQYEPINSTPIIAQEISNRLLAHQHNLKNR